MKNTHANNLIETSMENASAEVFFFPRTAPKLKAVNECTALRGFLLSSEII